MHDRAPECASVSCYLSVAVYCPRNCCWNFCLVTSACDPHSDFVATRRSAVTGSSNKSLRKSRVEKNKTSRFSILPGFRVEPRNNLVSILRLLRSCGSVKVRRSLVDIQDVSRLHTANTQSIQQYNGLKYTDDHSDARWLAHLLRLGVLPEGYIYPKEERMVRDLLRKRGQLVHQRTANLLSILSLISRTTGNSISAKYIKSLILQRVDEVITQPGSRPSAQSQSGGHEQR